MRPLNKLYLINKLNKIMMLNEITFYIDSTEFRIKNGRLYEFIDITYQWKHIDLNKLVEYQLEMILEAIEKEADKGGK